MIKSIVNLLFGGENKENLEQSLDYETKEEEEDWLLVNISEERKKSDENILLNGDTPLVPSSLPLGASMSPMSFFQSSPEFSIIPCASDILSPERVTFYSQEHSLSDMFEILPIEVYQSMSDWNVSASVFSESTEYLFATVKNANLVEESLPEKYEELLKKKSQALVPLNQSHPQADKRVSHPAELSRAFVHHKLPSLPPQTEVLEQVKILQANQKAKEHQMRKLYKKNHLNRQNKVKLYEGKAKKNRRKDLWQHHSGANNNRKCC